MPRKFQPAEFAARKAAADELKKPPTTPDTLAALRARLALIERLLGLR